MKKDEAERIAYNALKWAETLAAKGEYQKAQESLRPLIPELNSVGSGYASTLQSYITDYDKRQKKEELKLSGMFNVVTQLHNGITDNKTTKERLAREISLIYATSGGTPSDQQLKDIQAKAKEMAECNENITTYETLLTQRINEDIKVEKEKKSWFGNTSLKDLGNRILGRREDENKALIEGQDKAAAENKAWADAIDAAKKQREKAELELLKLGIEQKKKAGKWFDRSSVSSDDLRQMVRDAKLKEYGAFEGGDEHEAAKMATEAAEIQRAIDQRKKAEEAFYKTQVEDQKPVWFRMNRPGDIATFKDELHKKKEEELKALKEGKFDKAGELKIDVDARDEFLKNRKDAEKKLRDLEIDGDKKGWYGHTLGETRNKILLREWQRISDYRLGDTDGVELNEAWRSALDAHLAEKKGVLDKERALKIEGEKSNWFKDKSGNFRTTFEGKEKNKFNAILNGDADAMEAEEDYLKSLRNVKQQRKEAIGGLRQQKIQTERDGWAGKSLSGLEKDLTELKVKKQMLVASGDTEAVEAIDAKISALETHINNRKTAQDDLVKHRIKGHGAIGTEGPLASLGGWFGFENEPAVGVAINIAALPITWIVVANGIVGPVLDTFSFFIPFLSVLKYMIYVVAIIILNPFIKAILHPFKEDFYSLFESHVKKKAKEELKDKGQEAKKEVEQETDELIDLAQH